MQIKIEWIHKFYCLNSIKLSNAEFIQINCAPIAHYFITKLFFLRAITANVRTHTHSERQFHESENKTNEINFNAVI